jgi:hypothetical protein
MGANSNSVMLLKLCKWIRTMTKSKWRENDVVCNYA